MSLVDYSSGRLYEPDDLTSPLPLKVNVAPAPRPRLTRSSQIVVALNRVVTLAGVELIFESASSQSHTSLPRVTIACVRVRSAVVCLPHRLIALPRPSSAVGPVVGARRRRLRPGARAVAPVDPL